MAETRKIRVLLAQFSLETHSRGVITVAGMLRDAGMEVIYIGNNTPQQIVNAAVQEAVDVVGISTYCGGEVALCTDLMDRAARSGIKDKTVFLLGGIFPPASVPPLKKLGFDATFPPGSTREQISGFIRKAVARRSRVSGRRAS
jgi:methylmalonyl-CoA mutase C-terminal domain/subunit